VLIVPGYGLAVANAQHSIAELTKMLKKKGVQVGSDDSVRAGG
jgi:NAD/NADP transhydrogenase beta subunit